MRDDRAIAERRANRAALEEAIRNAEGEVLPSGRVRCPFHDDRNPSGSIYESDGVWRFRCHGPRNWFGDVFDVVQKADGCTFPEALAKLGIGNGKAESRRTPPKRSTKHDADDSPKLFETHEAAALAYGLGEPSSMFPYERDGEVVGYIVRWDAGPGRPGKRIRRVSRHGTGWAMKGMENPQPLYHGREALADLGTLLWVEGEGICDAARDIGLNAITTVGGKDNVHLADWAATKDRDAVLWPDAVDGIEAANTIAALRHELNPTGTTCIIDPASVGLTSKGDDIADWIEARGSCTDDDLGSQLESIIAGAAPWHPPADGDKGGRDGGQRLSVRSLAGVEPQPVEWLWPLRVPIGKVTIFMGYGDVGKSFLTHAIGAVVSAGMKWPLSSDWAETGDVLYLAHEDGVEDTIVPRLKAAGASMNRIEVIEGAIRKPGAEPDRVQLDRDLRHIDAALGARLDCRLLMIGPITAYLGEAESHKDADVRRVLGPLAKLAEKHRIAVVAILHWNKRLGAPAMLRGSGSVAFGNLARVVHAVAKDPRDATRHIMAVAKCNIAKHPPALGFRIDGDPPVVHWIADTPDIAADQLADGVKPKTQIAEVAEWLHKQLADGPKPSIDLIAEGIEGGFSEKTIRRAKREAGIRHRTTTDDDGNKRTVWFLPEPAQAWSGGQVGQLGQPAQRDRPGQPDRPDRPGQPDQPAQRDQDGQVPGSDLDSTGADRGILDPDPLLDGDWGDDPDEIPVPDADWGDDADLPNPDDFPGPDDEPAIDDGLADAMGAEAEDRLGGWSPDPVGAGGHDPPDKLDGPPPDHDYTDAIAVERDRCNGELFADPGVADFDPAGWGRR